MECVARYGVATLTIHYSRSSMSLEAQRTYVLPDPARLPAIQMYFKPFSTEWKRKCLDIVAVLSGSPRYVQLARHNTPRPEDGDGGRSPEGRRRDAGLEEDSFPHDGGVAEGGDAMAIGRTAVASGATFLSRAMIKILE